MVQLHLVEDKISSETKEVKLENVDKLISFLDMEAERIENIKLPLSFGKEWKVPKKNLITLNRVKLSILSDDLLNFKLVREKGLGRKTILLKGRECRLTFEGTIHENGNMTDTKLISYMVNEDLTFNRGLVVYGFMQNLLCGNDLTINSSEMNTTLNLPQRIEYLRILKVIEVLYRYYYLVNHEGFSSHEKVSYILKNSKQIFDIVISLKESNLDTMVKVEGKLAENLENGGNLKVVEDLKVKLKGKNYFARREIEFLETIPKNQSNVSKSSTIWRKAKIKYKKSLIN